MVVFAGLCAIIALCGYRYFHSAQGKVKTARNARIVALQTTYATDSQTPITEQRAHLQLWHSSGAFPSHSARQINKLK
jgi:hypothetical protein